MNFEETAGPTTLSNEPMPMSTFKKSILDFKNNDGMKDEIGGPESKDKTSVVDNIETPDVQLGGPGWGGRRKSRRSKKSTRRNKTKRKVNKSRKSRKSRK